MSLEALGRLLLAALLLLAAALFLAACPGDEAPDGTGDGPDPTDSPDTTAPPGETTTTQEPGARGDGRSPTARLAPESGTFSVCADCHFYLDIPGQVPATLMENFSHDAHIERGAECQSCHEPPIHTEQGTRLPTMARCFTCHGFEQEAAAPGDCELCHPPDFPLMPANHTPEFFAGGHARVVEQEGTEDCLFCHEGTEETFCEGCHGIEMPHPEGWTRTPDGHPGDHVQASFDEGEVCVRCHDNRVEPPGNCYGGECHGE
jgi:hypothetical protein